MEEVINNLEHVLEQTESYLDGIQSIHDLEDIYGRVKDLNKQAREMVAQLSISAQQLQSAIPLIQELACTNLDYIPFSDCLECRHCGYMRQVDPNEDHITYNVLKLEHHSKTCPQRLAASWIERQCPKQEQEEAEVLRDSAARTENDQVDR